MGQRGAVGAGAGAAPSPLPAAFAAAAHPRAVLPNPQFFQFFEASSCSPSPLQPGLPAVSAAAASPWLLIVASFPCCQATIFSFSKLLGSLPPAPPCSPAFPQHLLLPFPYGCS